MTNGKKESSKDSTGIKRISDILPEGDVPKLKQTIKDFLDLDLVIESVRDIIGSDGLLRGVSVSFTHKGERHTIAITHKRVMAKLKAVKDKMPVRATFRKGLRYYDVV